MLHTVNKSPFERNTLSTCLQHLTPGSVVLLIEDGIYGALKGTEATDMVKKAMASNQFYALWPDVEARGMQERVIEGIKMIDYEGFVDLAVEHKNVQAWL